MGKVSPLHQFDALTMPLADGATLRVTPFRQSPRVAITFHGPSGGDAGGALLTARRARLLASWLVRLAYECGAPAGPCAAGGATPRPVGRRAFLRDRDAALGALARVAVSVLADSCSIDVLEADGSLRRLTVAHADQKKPAVAKKLETLRRRMAGRATAVVGDARHHPAARRVRHVSSLTVPLSGRVRTLGVMTLVSARSRRRYAEADLKLARELGRLAGLVLETYHGRDVPADLARHRERKRHASRPGHVLR